MVVIAAGIYRKCTDLLPSKTPTLLVLKTSQLSHSVQRKPFHVFRIACCRAFYAILLQSPRPSSDYVKWLGWRTQVVGALASSKPNQACWFKNSSCAKTIYKRNMKGFDSTMSGKMEHQLASKLSLKLDYVEASAMRRGSLFTGPAERTAKAVFGLAK